jgi:predicted O-methyltransferase YrrM
MAEYEFTQDWFSEHTRIWQWLLAEDKPSKILEIGAYEGRSTCYVIETAGAIGDLEVHCIDTWQGSAEHRGVDMSAVEQRFFSNTSRAMGRVAHAVNLVVHKKPSELALAELLASGHALSFDLVYVDGSHRAPDVLSDSVLSFHLLRPGGLLVFDDYLWSMEAPGHEDPLNMPKLAIDSFVNVHRRQLQILPAHLNQLYVRKLPA